MAAVRFDLYMGPEGKYLFTLYGKDGNITAKSRGFQNKDDAMQGIQAVKELCQGTESLKQKPMDGGKVGFILQRANRQIVLEGGPYETPEALELAMASVRGSLHAAVIDRG